jgi:hypothetical protein
MSSMAFPTTALMQTETPGLLAPRSGPVPGHPRPNDPATAAMVVPTFLYIPTPSSAHPARQQAIRTKGVLGRNVRGGQEDALFERPPPQAAPRTRTITMRLMMIGGASVQDGVNDIRPCSLAGRFPTGSSSVTRPIALGKEFQHPDPQVRSPHLLLTPAHYLQPCSLSLSHGHSQKGEGGLHSYIPVP